MSVISFSFDIWRYLERNILMDEPVAGKCSRVSENSPTNQDKKKSKNSHVVSCSICEQDIIDDRDDSVFCEGICQTWLHRRCAGLSKQVFAILSKSKDPYMCSFCSLSKYKEEITGLRNQITSLTNELASLKCNRDCTNASDQTSSNIQNPTNVNANHDGEYSGIDVVKSFIAEEKEKAKCHLNIIVHQVPESTATEKARRYPTSYLYF